jgi:hypothetical protein
MKKINSKLQLRAEKRRIRIRRQELEEQIRCQWDELKESIKPVNIVKETFKKMVQKETRKNLEDESLIKSTLNCGISILAKRFTNKAGEQFKKYFNKNGH